MLEVLGYFQRDALRRRLVLAQPGTPALQPCLKPVQFVRSASRAERGVGRADVVPSYVENHGVSAEHLKPHTRRLPRTNSG